jgi:hypothetical protein
MVGSAYLGGLYFTQHTWPALLVRDLFLGENDRSRVDAVLFRDIGRRLSVRGVGICCLASDLE